MTEVQETSTEEVRPYDIRFWNPSNYHRELMNMGEFGVAWDSGRLHKLRIEPVKWANLNFRNMPWEAYVIDTDVCREYDPSCKDERYPKAVYPVWDASKGHWDDLEDWTNDPRGSDPEWCTDPDIERRSRPVYGQPHRIFITNVASKEIGDRNQLVDLSNFQVMHPEVELFIHGLTSFSALFGMAFRAGSYGPFMASRGGTLSFPNGAICNRRDEYYQHQKDIHALGWDVETLQNVPSERCMFNINSARLASVAWDTHQRTTRIKPRNWTARYQSSILKPADLPLINGEPHIPVADRKEGDMLSCNHCSVWRFCTKFREGSVCTVSSSEGKSLADHFRTTDSATIVKGLQAIMAKRAERVEQAMDEERFSEDGLNPDVEKMLSGLFKDGVTLAKLVDPTLRSPLVQQNFLNGNNKAKQIAEAGDSRALAAHVVEQLEARGIAQRDITEEMIDAYINEMMGEQKAIEAEFTDEA